jgi:hypothetical protein
MFRFTIRELVLVTAIVALVIAWGMDHGALATVREDAQALACYGDPHEGACGNVAGFWSHIAEKCWSEQIQSETKRKMQKAVEAELGINSVP